MEYLEFEKPIEQLIDKLQKAKELGNEESIDVTKLLMILKKN